MQLADLGADVLKVEEPERGDESRAFAPPFVGTESAYFLAVNRNKRGIAVDLKNAAGRDIVLRLAAQSDVVIENFRPGAMDRLGLGDAALAAVNPNLILCSISGFGREGPDAERPGYDLIIQGESGIMDVTGFRDGAPSKVGVSIGDLVAGLYAAQGILAALRRRDLEPTKQPIRVDISMLDGLASLLTFTAGIYFATGTSPTRRGNEHPTIAPYETFAVADGWLNVAVANDRFWRLFCQAVDAPELASDARFETAPQRVAHRAVLTPLVADILAQRSRAEWLTALGAAGVPCGAIRTIDEICTAPQLTERGMVLETLHPSAGIVRSIGSPVRFDSAPPAAALPSPMLGEHTRSVLTDRLGLDDEAIDALIRSGAVGARAVETDHG